MFARNALKVSYESLLRAELRKYKGQYAENIGCIIQLKEVEFS